jgi:hypothetical protein
MSVLHNLVSYILGHVFYRNSLPYYFYQFNSMELQRLVNNHFLVVGFCPIPCMCYYWL